MSSNLGLVAEVVPSSCVDGPGNRFVVFVQGCTFNCLACHNPHTIARNVRPGGEGREGDGGGPVELEVEDLVEQIAGVAPFLSGVTVSGGEPTTQWEFVHELFRRLAGDARTAHLDRLVDTNGDADLEVWDVLVDSMHGAMVDLKALDPHVHYCLTQRRNDRVLASIRHLAERGRLAEVRLLLVPGVNDTTDQMVATAAFLRGLPGGAPPVRLLGFRDEGTRSIARHFRVATDADLAAARTTLAAEGVVAE